MNRSEGYRAQWTVTRSYEHLSRERPIYVHTVLYPPADGSGATVSGDPSLFCGPVNRLPSATEASLQGRPHDHHHYEIALVVTGTAQHTTAQGQCHVEPGSVQVVAPYEVHGYSRVDGMGIVVCAYLGEWLLSDARELLSEKGFVPLFLCADLYGSARRTDIPHWRLDDATLHACVHEMRDIVSENDRPTPSQTYLKACLKKLMIVLGHAFMESGNTLLPDRDRRVEQVLHGIEEHISEGTHLNVAELAKQLGVSSSHLRSFFHHATGRSPMEYYQWRRIQQSCWMLLNTDLSVTEIAHSLGYSDSAHLTNCFKRHRQMTPRDYRAKYCSHVPHEPQFILHATVGSRRPR